MSKKEKNVPQISFINWIITLICSIIPGFNILFFIIVAASAKTKSKRTYAAAALVLTLVFLIVAAVAVVFFSDKIVDWARSVLAAKVPAEI